MICPLVTAREMQFRALSTVPVLITTSRRKKRWCDFIHGDKLSRVLVKVFSLTTWHFSVPFARESRLFLDLFVCVHCHFLVVSFSNAQFTLQRSGVVGEENGKILHAISWVPRSVVTAIYFFYFSKCLYLFCFFPRVLAVISGTITLKCIYSILFENIN